LVGEKFFRPPKLGARFPPLQNLEDGSRPRMEMWTIEGLPKRQESMDKDIGKEIYKKERRKLKADERMY